MYGVYYERLYMIKITYLNNIFFMYACIVYYMYIIIINMYIIIIYNICNNTNKYSNKSN